MNHLPNDSTVNSIFEKLTKMTNEKYNSTLSTKDIRAIVESSYKILPVAVKRGDTVKHPHLGKFGIKQKRVKYITSEHSELIMQMQKVPVEKVYADCNIGY